MGADGESSKVKIAVAILGVVGTIGAAVVAGIFLLASMPDAARGDNSPTPPSTSSAPASPPPASAPPSTSSTTPTTPPPTKPNKERVAFHAPAGKYGLYGETVWRSNDDVAIAGGFELNGADLSKNCSIRAEFTRMDINGNSFGNIEKRQCPGEKPAAAWPEFTVDFGDDDAIAGVKVVSYVDDAPAVTLICRRHADCEQIS